MSTSIPEDELDKLIESCIAVDLRHIATNESTMYLSQLKDAIRQYAAKARADEVDKIPNQLNDPGDYECYDLNHKPGQCSLCYKKMRIKQLKEGIGDE